MSNSLFIDIGSCQRQKDGEDCFGDTIYSKKIPEERRVISILSDGLGSGVKANILSSMTTRMAMKFMEDNTDLLRSSEIMMDALPICQIRKISYATFSIVDSELEGKTRIFEMDNPRYIFIRNHRLLAIKGPHHQHFAGYHPAGRPHYPDVGRRHPGRARQQALSARLGTAGLYRLRFKRN